MSSSRPAVTPPTPSYPVSDAIFSSTPPPPPPPAPSAFTSAWPDASPSPRTTARTGSGNVGNPASLRSRYHNYNAIDNNLPAAPERPSAGASYTSFPPNPPRSSSLAAASNPPRTSSLLPPARILVDQGAPHATAPVSDPFSDPFSDPRPAPKIPDAARESDSRHRRGHSRGHSRSSSAGGLSDTLRNLNRWSASTTSSRASNFVGFTRRVSTEVLGAAFHSPGKKLHKHRPSTSDSSPRSSAQSRFRTESPAAAPIPPLAALPRISTGPSLEHEVLESNLLGVLSSTEESQPHQERREDIGGYWDGRSQALEEERGLPSQRPTPAEPPPPSTMITHESTMAYTQNGHARGHSRGRSTGPNSSADMTRERERGAKHPSQKAMLSKALQKANTAVQLDNAQNLEGARRAYAEACAVLQQVLLRTSGEEDRRKLEAIHETYLSRVMELDEQLIDMEPGGKELPHRPESGEMDDMLGVQIAGDDYSHPYTAARDRTYADDVDSQPAYAIQATARNPPPPSGAAPIVYADASMDPKEGSTSYLTQQYSLRSAFSGARYTNSSSLRPPMENAYMPPPLSPRRPSSPARASPPPREQVSPKRTAGPEIPVSSGRLAQQAPSSHQRANSHESVSWLDPIDESEQSSVSSVHSRSSSKVRRKHIRAASGATGAEFDAALDDAIEAAYDDGYEPESDYFGHDYHHGLGDPIANTLRRVEMARELVREHEREALELANEREKRLRLQQQLEDEEYRRQEAIGEDFYDGNDSEEGERLLEEVTAGDAIEDFSFGGQSRPSVPRESDSSGMTNRTWPSSMGSNPPTATTLLTPVSEDNVLPQPSGPLPALPIHAVSQLPPQPGSAGSQSPGQSVRNRRLSGQNPKELKIETTKLAPSAPTAPATTGGAIAAQSKSGNYIVQQRQALSAGANRTLGPLTSRLGPSPIPPGALGDDSDDGPLPPMTTPQEEYPRVGTPSIVRPSLRKNYSSSSLKSLRSRNPSISHLEETSDLSPGTPLSTQFGARLPAVPSLPPGVKERANSTTPGGLQLFESDFHSSETPGSPNALAPDAPAPLEPCPSDVMLRPFWLMRCLYQTLCHPRGGYLSNKLFVPRDVWRVKGVKLRNLEDKIANCDLLTASLQKLGRVDTCDADAVLEEMQSLEGVLEQVKTTLSRKLGSEVGPQGAGSMFKDANAVDADPAAMPRSASVAGKASSFSWRRLRSKNSSANLPGLATSYGGKGGSGGASSTNLHEGATGKDTMLASLPMTSHPTSRPTKRDVASVTFAGPNANYMASLARLFDAAQAVDQIARQVDDPGLRHADKTQVGLELCTKHATDFFTFYICRFRRAAELETRIAAIPIERYRNFCIVAHIDHGKSTLSDRLLEHTGTISPSDANKQILDKLDVERERGITVKAQTCTMIYRHPSTGDDYLLHLVDTPGHVDFRAEVTRSYASCGGALLLVDASQGVQAQTVANFYLAFAQGLALVPVVNKIDLPTADVDRALGQLESVFELDTSRAVRVSAKTGQGVGEILPAVIDLVPAPVGDTKRPLRMLLVDSWYDHFKGVVLLVRVFDGTVKAGDRLVSLGTGNEYTVGEVGIQYPNQVPQRVLRAGQVGYVFFNPGMKKIQDAKIGDTFTTVGSEDVVKPYPGFEEPKPMVFVAAFPTDQGDYNKLADSIGQLVLNDRSVTLQKDFSEALGAGWRLGFLGSLHCSVFQDRLRQEHGADIIITEPAVPTKIVWNNGGPETIITNPAEFPDTDDVRLRRATIYEPFVLATITLPDEYLGRVIEICENARGMQKSIEYFHATQVILKYEVPMSSLVDDLFGKLKGATKGYATLDYEDAGWRESSLVKMNLLVNKKPVDAIARVVHSSQVERLGRQWVTKFKEHVERQMFEVIIQAAAGKRIVARETIKPFRKDVLAKLHASDITRRRKLLEKQKAGRKRLRAVGNVVIEQAAFQKFLAK
ncbi:hypothetical protein C8A03DRAFT_45094 [Achaetomium macrosporum]|uniref:Tr-type G domain-containing protein n=1 Tax=Achaetomium macrosporum TaxID=79813 RepID=A0AAN7C7S8_9PEZI|nr:hypothetical protein C8A03DRAFT_45094 [Achaetomium macrosporum]